VNEPEAVLRDGKRILGVASALALLGVLALGLGALVAPARFFSAYLTAYAYVVTTALGALVFLMICHAMRAGWPTLLRRLIEAMVATLPVLAVLFVPLLFGLRRLYPWLRLETIADERARELVARKLSYLSVPGFVGRTVFYFFTWILVGALLVRWSERSDAAPAFPARGRMYVLSGALLPVIALSVSFAACDWLMSLTPTWYSTMFPIYVFAGGFLAALALLTVLTAAADVAGLIPGIRPSHYYALGRLLLAFVIFWAYVGFFQLMLIWMTNKPEEITYYLDRVRGGWKAMTVVLAVTHFVLPFLVLLNYDLKQRRGPLAAVAAWLLAAHYLDAYWLVMPGAESGGPGLVWLDLGALLAVAGVAVAAGVLRLRGRLLVPIHDPLLARARSYDSR
jgi:hypothetical protein